MSALENALARLEFLRSVDRCGKEYSDNRGGVAFPVDIWVDRGLIFIDAYPEALAISLGTIFTKLHLGQVDSQS